MLALAAAIVLGGAGFLCLVWAALNFVAGYWVMWFAPVDWLAPMLWSLAGATLVAAALYIRTLGV